MNMKQLAIGLTITIVGALVAFWIWDKYKTKKTTAVTTTAA